MFVGVSSEFSTVSILQESGLWKVTAIVKEGRLNQEGEWEYKQVEFSSLNEDMKKANTDVMLTAQQYVSSIGGNLWKG